MAPSIYIYSLGLHSLPLHLLPQHASISLSLPLSPLSSWWGLPSSLSLSGTWPSSSAAACGTAARRARPYECGGRCGLHWRWRVDLRWPCLCSSGMDPAVCPDPPLSPYLDLGLAFISLSLSQIHDNGDGWAMMAGGAGATNTGSGAGRFDVASCGDDASPSPMLLHQAIDAAVRLGSMGLWVGSLSLSTIPSIPKKTRRSRLPCPH